MPQPHRKVTARCPCGGLTAPLQWQYGKLVVAAKNVRVPYVRLPVSFHESYGRRAVAVTFVTTTTVARKILQFLKITFYKP